MVMAAVDQAHAEGLRGVPAVMLDIAGEEAVAVAGAILEHRGAGPRADAEALDRMCRITAESDESRL